MAKDKRKPPKRLFKDPDRVSSYGHDLSSTARMKRMARDHADVLQNIEFGLVAHWRSYSRTDDRFVAEALKANIAGKEAADPNVNVLAERLKEIREMRSEIADDVWAEALRVVLDSVDRHSEYKPGEISYLQFAGKYVS